MGTDEFFKKKRAALEERKRESRTPKPNSFLIVTEGEKTEPQYFDGLANYINNKYGKSIDVEKPTIDTHGKGMHTVSLVEETSKIANRAHIIYQHVWVVFDKDDFEDFNEAISLAENYNFQTAWSNQSFEYWIYLHFYYSDAALHRNNWVEKLNSLFKANGISSRGYLKNDPNIFSIVTTSGSLKFAVSNAIRIEQTYRVGELPSQQDPCTKVHHLILQLKPYISEFL